jgi:RNA-directed DNA polymerase
MLMALEGGIKGGVWFSLIDKIWAERTLQLAWEQVQSNAGACGVDGISVAHFEKDSQARLLAVKEHLKQGRYPLQAGQTGLHPKTGQQRKEAVGHTDGH